MERIQEVWERFKNNKRKWEDGWASLITWIIGLDGLLIGASFPITFNLQKEIFFLRLLGGAALFFIAISFVTGIYYEKKKVDLSYLDMDQTGKEYLVEVDKAIAAGNGISQDAKRRVDKWVEAVGKAEKEDSLLKKYGEYCTNTCFVGLILLLTTGIGIIFKRDILKCITSVNAICCHSVPKPKNEALVMPK